MDQYGLQPQASGHFTGYDINLNAGIANSVAAAALWFVASLIPKSLTVSDNVSLFLQASADLPPGKLLWLLTTINI
jgi:hypothetical protein